RPRYSDETWGHTRLRRNRPQRSSLGERVPIACKRCFRSRSARRIASVLFSPESVATSLARCSTSRFLRFNAMVPLHLNSTMAPLPEGYFFFAGGGGVFESSTTSPNLMVERPSYFL